MPAWTLRLVAQSGQKQAEALDYKPESHQCQTAALPGQQRTFGRKQNPRIRIAIDHGSHNAACAAAVGRIAATDLPLSAVRRV
jgi:hypothetical protein